MSNQGITFKISQQIFETAFLMTIASRLFIDNSALDDEQLYGTGKNDGSNADILYVSLIVLAIYLFAFLAKGVLYNGYKRA